MMENLAIFAAVAFVSFFFFLIGEPIFRFFLRFFGVYAVVEEGTCHVYVLFGKVRLILHDAGIHLLWMKIGPIAFLTRLVGQRYILDMRLDQMYLRSQPVNSEEGAPMGIGIWHEMYISDPVAFLFRNTDPRGSLSANVSNATVRSLSNLPLGAMLESRHIMSRMVREEVSPKSEQWGYKLGSVYIRKVHFRDRGMIQQIEEKVVNRLRQVTSAILQDGANRVSVITSTAERQAAVEFAKAEAMRPKIVGQALKEIMANPAVADAMFEVLELENILGGGDNQLVMIPPKNELLAQLLATPEVTN